MSSPHCSSSLCTPATVAYVEPYCSGHRNPAGGDPGAVPAPRRSSGGMRAKRPDGHLLAANLVLGRHRRAVVATRTSTATRRDDSIDRWPP